MKKKTQIILMQVALVIAVIVLQVYSMRFNYYHQQRLKNLDYGLESGGFMLAMEGFSLLSGLALAWLPPKTQHEGSRQGRNLGSILLLVFTLLLVIIKIVMLGFGKWWSVDFFLNVMPIYGWFGQWVYATQVPSLLAGLSLGRLLRK